MLLRFEAVKKWNTQVVDSNKKIKKILCRVYPELDEFAQQCLMNKLDEVNRQSLYFNDADMVDKNFLVYNTLFIGPSCCPLFENKQRFYYSKMHFTLRAYPTRSDKKRLFEGWLFKNFIITIFL